MAVCSGGHGITSSRWRQWVGHFIHIACAEVLNAELFELAAQDIMASGAGHSGKTSRQEYGRVSESEKVNNKMCIIFTHTRFILANYLKISNQWQSWLLGASVSDQGISLESSSSNQIVPSINQRIVVENQTDSGVPLSRNREILAIGDVDEVENDLDLYNEALSNLQLLKPASKFISTVQSLYFCSLLSSSKPDLMVVMSTGSGKSLGFLLLAMSLKETSKIPIK
jgi:hypothetical protein